MNSSKFSFDGLSRCFPQFKMVYAFLECFFQNIAEMMLPNMYSIPVKKAKQLKLNTVNKNDEHNLISKN